jgi:hypothetical protein
LLPPPVPAAPLEQIFGARPDDLPPDLASQLHAALELAPSVVTASLRTGCACITASLLASRGEAAALEARPGGAAAALAQAVAAALDAAGAPAKVLVRRRRPALLPPAWCCLAAHRF